MYNDITRDNIQTEIPGDGDVNDTSGNGITPAGVNITFNPSEIGYRTEVMKGNGATTGAGSSMVDIDVVSANRIGAANSSWTIFGLFKNDVLPASGKFATICSGRGGGTADSGTFPFELFYLGTSGVISFDIRSGGTNTSTQLSYSSKFADGEWHYFFCEADNGTTRLYIGDLESWSSLSTAQATNTYTASNDYRKPLAEQYELFTSLGGTTNGVFGGELQNFRILDGILTERQKREFLFEAFGLLGQANNKKLLEGLVFSADFRDNSLYNVVTGESLTNNGTTATTDQFGRANYARNFDGINDSVDTGKAGGNIYTIGCWVKLGETNGNKGIMENYKVDNTGALIRTTDSGNGIKFWHRNASSVWDTYGYATTDTTNRFHVAQTYDGTTIRRYVNGSLVNSSTNTFAQSDSTYYLGAIRTGVNFCNCNITSPIILDRAMSTGEIAAYYDLSSNLSTVDTLYEYNGVMPAWFSPSLYIPGYNNGTTFYDFSGNGNNGTQTGGVSSANINKNTLNIFDGSNDIVNAGTSNDIKPTTALTLGCWVKRDNTLRTESLIYNSWQDVNADGYRLILVDSSGQKLNFSFYTTAQQTLQIDYSDWSDTNWHFIVASWDGSNAYIYIDGLQVGTAAISGTISYNSSSNFVYGARNRDSGNDIYYDGSSLFHFVDNKLYTEKMAQQLYYATYPGKDVI